MHHYSQEKPLLESLSLTFSSWFFVFSFLTNWKKSIVAFISTFRSRHWELLCKTAARQDISKIDMFFLTKLELVFSIVYERKFINILKIKPCAGILLELRPKISSCRFTEQLLFLHNCEWLLLISYLINKSNNSSHILEENLKQLGCCNYYLALQSRTHHSIALKYSRCNSNKRWSKQCLLFF